MRRHRLVCQWVRDTRCASTRQEVPRQPYKTVGDFMNEQPDTLVAGRRGASMNRGRLFSAEHKDGEYRPRHRPERIVMPVDLVDKGSLKRQFKPGAAAERHIKASEAFAARKTIKSRAVLRAAVVPEEHTVAECYRHMLERCFEERSITDDVTDPAVLPLEIATEALNTACDVRDTPTAQPVSRSPSLAVFGASEDRLVPCGRSATGVALTAGYRQWDLLSATPLRSPVHGHLAQRGRSLVEHYVAQQLRKAFPRLRGRIVQSLLRKYVSGPLAAMRVAKAIGLTTFANYNVEVGLYTEMLLLSGKLQQVQLLFSFHAHRHAAGIVPNQYQRYLGLRKSLSRQLRTLPVDGDTLHLRVQWLTDHLFAFCAFMEVAEGREVFARFVDHHFIPALARYRHTQEVIRGATNAIARHAHTLERLTPAQLQLLQLVRDVLAEVLAMGDGRDLGGYSTAAEGLHNRQLMMARHAAEVRGLLEAQAAGAEDPRALRALAARLQAATTQGHGDAPPALQTFLAYHPLSDAADEMARRRAATGGLFGVNPHMDDDGGSGLLLDAGGGDEEVAGAARRYGLTLMRHHPIEQGGVLAPNAAETMRRQLDALRSYQRDFSAAPAPVISAANSTIPEALREVQLILKYSPSVSQDLFGTASPEGAEAKAPGQLQYSLDVEVAKRTDVFNTGHRTNVTEGQVRRQQEVHAASLYLYANAPDAVRRHLLATGIGLSPESATQAACLAVAKKYYFHSPSV